MSLLWPSVTAQTQLGFVCVRESLSDHITPRLRAHPVSRKPQH